MGIQLTPANILIVDVHEVAVADWDTCTFIAMALKGYILNVLGFHACTHFDLNNIPLAIFHRVQNG